jgi:hypothetical protein
LKTESRRRDMSYVVQYKKVGNDAIHTVEQSSMTKALSFSADRAFGDWENGACEDIVIGEMKFANGEPYIQPLLAFEALNPHELHGPPPRHPESDDGSTS